MFDQTAIAVMARRYPDQRQPDEKAVCNILHLARREMTAKEITDFIRSVMGTYPKHWRMTPTVLKHLEKRGLIKSYLYERGWYRQKLYYHCAFPPESQAQGRQNDTPTIK